RARDVRGCLEVSGTIRQGCRARFDEARLAGSFKGRLTGLPFFVFGRAWDPNIAWELHHASVTDAAPVVTSPFAAIREDRCVSIPPAIASLRSSLMRILACLAALSFSVSGVAADPIADRQ